jgi:hypothetical protein
MIHCLYRFLYRVRIVANAIYEDTSFMGFNHRQNYIILESWTREFILSTSAKKILFLVATEKYMPSIKIDSLGSIFIFLKTLLYGYFCV